jgi:hypothetical protein
MFQSGVRHKWPAQSSTSTKIPTYRGEKHSTTEMFPTTPDASSQHRAVEEIKQHTDPPTGSSKEPRPPT